MPDTLDNRVFEDDRLDWMRHRLWRLVFASILGLTPMISARYGLCLSFTLVLAAHFPALRDISSGGLRDCIRQTQAQGS